MVAFKSVAKKTACVSVIAASVLAGTTLPASAAVVRADLSVGVQPYKDAWKSGRNAEVIHKAQACVDGQPWYLSGSRGTVSWFQSMRRSENSDRIWASANYSGQVTGRCSAWINWEGGVYVRITVHPSTDQWDANRGSLAGITAQSYLGYS
jgi:hypothetical protein